MSVYRWWARRTSAITGALLDAALKADPSAALICDPFSGGGGVGLEAATRGLTAYLQDIEPWAALGVAQMLDLPDEDALRAAETDLGTSLGGLLRAAYGTEHSDGTPAMIAHTLRVAVGSCLTCSESIKLFPYALLTLRKRSTRDSLRGWLACRAGHLFEGDPKRGSACPECSANVDPAARYTLGRSTMCPHCGHGQKISDLAEVGPLSWEVALVQRVSEGRQEIVTPSPAEISQADDERWSPVLDLGLIAAGPESRVLLRHGFRKWQDCYPARQRAVMEELLKACRCVQDSKVANALSLAAVGTAEMAGYLSRWDRKYLKAYEAMAAHRFNFTTFASEPHVWGAGVGRGTFRKRVAALGRAASWMGTNVPALKAEGPLKSKRRRGRIPQGVDIRVVEGSSVRMLLTQRSADLILTDPPYHDDVQYRELSALFRAWAGLAVDGRDAVAHFGRDPDYERVLHEAFRECNRVLKPNGRMLITFANRSYAAWAALFAALATASFVAVGFEVVHAENETDLAKRGVSSCKYDLVLELVRKEDSSEFSVHQRRARHDDDEETEFLTRLGSWRRPRPPDPSARASVGVVRCTPA